MNFTLKIWRQPGRKSPGALKIYTIGDVSADMSILEMLDGLNQNLVKAGEDPVAFDSDCREGICGSCGLFINGRA
ncbi:MAG TPA: 2Fe-2S iron-sulfur cluster-binding protein, partial [Bacteroidota bacterium]|nr:2Fe-2S iron-sulfur cluster-binding protein [Bacteroidota bacterium]